MIDLLIQFSRWFRGMKINKESNICLRKSYKCAVQRDDNGAGTVYKIIIFSC